MYKENIMARNKYPEETVNLILNVAQRLFIQNGYDKTSMQDIINELGGLTKGAIYHHFKSKEEIFIAVTNRLYDGMDKKMAAIRDAKELTGLEKLKRMFFYSLNASSQNEVFSFIPNMLDNPKFLAIQMQSIMAEAAPLYLTPIIHEGIADGSIKTDYPQELAESLLLLANIWLNPSICNTDLKSVKKRCLFFKDLFSTYGLDIIDDSMIEKIELLFQFYQKKA